MAEKSFSQYTSASQDQAGGEPLLEQSREGSFLLVR